MSEIKRTINSAYNASTNISLKQESKNSVQGLTALARVENYLNDKYDIRFNIISTKLEYKLRDSNEHYKELNENSIFRELQHNSLSISLNKLTSLMQSDFVQPYNPFEDYFYGLSPWAETDPDYIGKLCTYLPIKDEERFNVQFKKMLVRCIACAIEVRVFNKQIFVLVHDKQNSGKSTLCRWLCPPKLANYIAENINTDKDSLIALTTNLLINMDELTTLSKSEINSLKSFMSKDKVNVRLPFAKKATILPRRASFIGSTNRDEFLVDETGSVRWLCFSLIGNINFNYKVDIDIDDVWRQAFALYKSGFDYNMSLKDIEENEQANKHFQVNSFEQEIIASILRPSNKADGGLFMTATDVYNKLTQIQPSLAAKATIQSVGKALTLLGFEKESKYDEGKAFSRKGYYVSRL